MKAILFVIRSVFLSLALFVSFATPARASFSLVQNPTDASCSTNSANCTVPLSSTGAGHLLIIAASNSGSSNAFLNVVSGGCAVSWVIPAGAQSAGGSTTGAQSFAYCLFTSAGATSIPITWTNASPGFSVVQPWEYSFTAAAVALDPGASGGVGTVSNPFSGATQPGVPLTLAGANDVIVQQMFFSNNPTVSAISSPYGNFTGSTNSGTADLENTNNGNAPTWTALVPGVSRGTAIAFTEVASVRNGGIGGKAAIGGKAGIGD